MAVIARVLYSTLYFTNPNYMQGFELLKVWLDECIITVLTLFYEQAVNDTETSVSHQRIHFLPYKS